MPAPELNISTKPYFDACPGKRNLRGPCPLYEMLNISASSNTRHRYDIKLYNCYMSLHSHPGCRDAPQGPTSSKYSSGRGHGAGCLERWGTMCLSGSKAGSAISPGEAVPRELLKQHFISKQGPGDLLCEGLDGASQGSAEQGGMTPG